MPYKATHILKKDFIANGYEMYKKGTYVGVPRPHRKHVGLCCNVAFLTKKGAIKENKVGMLALFDLDHFIPRKDWFIPIQKKV